MANKFKVGDKVRRVKDEWYGMRVGDVDTIKYISSDLTISLHKYGSGHSSRSFELVVGGGRHKHYDCIVAWADGQTIQKFVTWRGKNEWTDVSAPRWADATKYRIKPINPNADKIAELEAKAQDLADELKKLKESS